MDIPCGIQNMNKKLSRYESKMDIMSSRNLLMKNMSVNLGGW